MSNVPFAHDQSRPSRDRRHPLALAPRRSTCLFTVETQGLIVRITQHSAGYDNSVVYLDGRKIVDYVWADDQTCEVLEITGSQKQELRKGKKLEIVLNAGSSRF
jgi:hypothetical protein